MAGLFHASIRQQIRAAPCFSRQLATQSIPQPFSSHNLLQSVASLEESVADGGFPAHATVSALLRRATREAGAAPAERMLSAADACGLALDARQLGWALGGAAAHRDGAQLESLVTRKVGDFPGALPMSALARVVAGHFALGQRGRALRALDAARAAGAPLAGVLPAIVEELLRAFSSEPPTQRLFGHLEACEERFGASVGPSSVVRGEGDAFVAKLAAEVLEAREAVTLRRAQLRRASYSAFEALESLVNHFGAAMPSAMPDASEVDALLTMLLGNLAANDIAWRDVCLCGDSLTIFANGEIATHNLEHNRSGNERHDVLTLAPHAFCDLNDDAPSRLRLFLLLTRALSSKQLAELATPQMRSVAT
jgi:hypothetical protein